MAEKTIYLVSRGEYSDYTVEFACVTKALAEAGVERVRERMKFSDPYVETLQLLDYVPDLVEVHTFVLRLDQRTGWHMDLRPQSESRWDHEAPQMGVSVEIESGDSYGRYTVQLIRVSHSDSGAARTTAEAMLAELRRTGTKELGEAPDA